MDSEGSQKSTASMEVDGTHPSSSNSLLDNSSIIHVYTLNVISLDSLLVQQRSTPITLTRFFLLVISKPQVKGPLFNVGGSNLSL